MISRGIIFDGTNNYGIVKTETVIGFSPKQNSFMHNMNSTSPFEWLITDEDFRRSFTETPTEQPKSNSKKKKSLGKGHKKKHSKIKKCKSKHLKMMKKYLVPIIIGLLVAKSILIPLAFKALAFISFKGMPKVPLHMTTSNNTAYRRSLVKSSL